eukprot:COSAG03_NODE_8_length_24035_cov_36.331885_8_plen_187_part_00
MESTRNRIWCRLAPVAAAGAQGCSSGRDQDFAAQPVQPFSTKLDRKVYSRKRSVQNGWTGWAGRARLGVTRHPHTHRHISHDRVRRRGVGSRATGNRRSGRFYALRASVGHYRCTIHRVCTLLLGRGGLTLTPYPHPSPHRPSPSPLTLTLPRTDPHPHPSPSPSPAPTLTLTPHPPRCDTDPACF